MDLIFLSLSLSSFLFLFFAHRSHACSFLAQLSYIYPFVLSFFQILLSFFLYYNDTSLAACLERRPTLNLWITLMHEFIAIKIVSRFPSFEAN